MVIAWALRVLRARTAAANSFFLVLFIPFLFFAATLRGRLPRRLLLFGKSCANIALQPKDFTYNVACRALRLNARRCAA
jgi:hypothetical protein